MARRTSRPLPTRTIEVHADRVTCPACGCDLYTDYWSRRVVTTLDGVVALHVAVRRCHAVGCPRFHWPVRPAAELRIALPHHEFGYDVLALVGTLRYAHHRSVPEIHAALRARGVAVALRTITNLLDRYDELLALHVTDDARLHQILKPQGHVVLALDGLAPDVGHEVLWVLRDCLSGEVIRARSLLSARHLDLLPLLRDAATAVGVPITGVISDGQRSVRKAVHLALPGVPHQLCHFHYLLEAARPVYEADRHAKKRLKAALRGIRPLERAVESRTDRIALVTRGYCVAVRSALTDDGRPPLTAAGLRLHERITAIATSLERVAKKGGAYPN